MVSVQVTISFALLVGAGLFVRAYQQMTTTTTGFETRQVLSTEMRMRSRFSARQPWSVIHHSLIQRIEALPGVQSVAYTSKLPIVNRSLLEVQIPDGPVRQVGMNAVSSGFFNTLGISIVHGRTLQESDPPCGPGICSVVVSQALVQDFWPNEDPLGKTLRTPRGSVLEIVGVARNVSSQQVGGTDGPLIYLPWNPNDGPHSMLIRFTGDAGELSLGVTAIVREAIPDISIKIRTIQSLIEERVAAFREQMILIAILGGIGLVLAVIGIYGIVSFAVSQRSKEFGIRIALGARKKDIYSAVLSSCMRPIAIGLLVGLMLAFSGSLMLTRVLRLQHPPSTINAYDPIAFAGAIVALTAVALAAMLSPARRATKVDPIVTLRYE